MPSPNATCVAWVPGTVAWVSPLSSSSLRRAVSPRTVRSPSGRCASLVPSGLSVSSSIVRRSVSLLTGFFSTRVAPSTVKSCGWFRIEEIADQNAVDRFGQVVFAQAPEELRAEGASASMSTRSGPNTRAT